MFSKSLLLSAAIFSTTITAQDLLSNRSLEERATRSLGGYALITTLCPNDMDQCGGSTYCCPTTLTCIAEGYVDNICCPGTLNCWAALDAAPYCADDTWSLWDQSAGGIVLHQYFCCAPGLVGTVAGKCAAADTISLSNPQALQLAPGGAVLGSAATSTTVVVVSPTGTVVTVTSTSSAAVVVSSSITVKTLTSTSITSNNSTSATSSTGSSKSSTTSSASSTSTSASATTATTASGSSSASPSATTKASGAMAGNNVAGVVLFVQFVVGIWVGLL